MVWIYYASLFQINMQWANKVENLFKNSHVLDSKNKIQIWQQYNRYEESLLWKSCSPGIYCKAKILPYHYEWGYDLKNHLFFGGFFVNISFTKMFHNNSSLKKNFSMEYALKSCFLLDSIPTVFIGTTHQIMMHLVQMWLNRIIWTPRKNNLQE